MKLVHIADLHLGKSFHGLSLLESGDQPHWVEGFLRLCGEVRPDAVLIAGDVYDRGAPAAGAVELLSRLITGLTDLGAAVLMVPGNHDSAQRLAFGRELLARGGFHVAPPLTAPGALSRVTLEDEHGPVDFWLLPYLFPALAGEALGIELRDYDAAVRAVLGAQPIDASRRNVVVAHQNVTAGGVEGERGGSESTVGGVGQVDYTAFEGFDYAALGHIHAGYPVGRAAVRYAGSPLCYHFHETKQAAKGPLLVELGPKGTEPRLTLLPIEPLHRLRAIEGTFEEVRAELAGRVSALQAADGRVPSLQGDGAGRVSALQDADGRVPSLQEGGAGRLPALQDADGRVPSLQGEYWSITLTDRRVTPELAEELRALCEARNGLLMELSSVWRAGDGEAALTAAALKEMGLAELFADFYTQRNRGAEPDGAELELLKRAAELAESSDLRLPPDETQIDTLVRFAKRRLGDGGQAMLVPTDGIEPGCGRQGAVPTDGIGTGSGRQIAGAADGIGKEVEA